MNPEMWAAQGAEKVRRTEAMKKVNLEHEDYETLFKNAQVYALFNEISHICR